MENQVHGQNAVGKNIREFRVKNGETQQTLGEIIGYSATTVANYESGYRLPDIITARIIAEHYGVTIEELFKVE